MYCKNRLAISSKNTTVTLKIKVTRCI